MEPWVWVIIAVAAVLFLLLLLRPGRRTVVRRGAGAPAPRRRWFAPRRRPVARRW